MIMGPLLRRNTAILEFIFICSMQQLLINYVTGNNGSSSSTTIGNGKNQNQIDGGFIQQLLQSTEEIREHHDERMLTAVGMTNMMEQINHKQSLIDQQLQTAEIHDQLLIDENMRQMKELEHVFETTLSLLSGDYQNTTITKPIQNEALTATTTGSATMKELESLRTTDYLWSESNSIVLDWITTALCQVDFSQYATSSFIVSTATHPTTGATTKKNKSFSDTSTCIYGVTAIMQVYDGLLRYIYGEGSDMIDYTESIVHQYTTPTYVDNRNDDSDQLSTLRAVWWNRYIPQDWESLLFPTGWQSWKVSQYFRFPDHIYHSFGFEGTYTSNGCRHCSAEMASPEAILQPSTLPGQCWPVPKTIMTQQRQTAPTVMIRLRQPIKVTAITIEHTFKRVLILLQHHQQKLQSAPKRIKIYGYQPCNNDRNNYCRRLGFDEHTKTLLTEIIYNIEDGDNVQTFPVHYSSSSHSKHNTRTTTIKKDSEDGSCLAITDTSATQPSSCTSSAIITPVPGATATVTLEILDNWGNTDYTCLYRVRVHGEPIH